MEEEVAAILRGSAHVLERSNKELTEEEEKALLAMDLEEVGNTYFLLKNHTGRTSLKIFLLLLRTKRSKVRTGKDKGGILAVRSRTSETACRSEMLTYRLSVKPCFITYQVAFHSFFRQRRGDMNFRSYERCNLITKQNVAG